MQMICNTYKLILEHHQRGREGKSSMDEHEQRKHLQEVNLIIIHLLVIMYPPHPQLHLVSLRTVVSNANSNFHNNSVINN